MCSTQRSSAPASGCAPNARAATPAWLAGWEYLYIDSDTAFDRDCTVIELELDGELELFEHHTRD